MTAVIKDMGIFDGPLNRRVFLHNVSLLRDNRYQTAGSFVRWSLRNGGPGIPCLSPALFGCMVDTNHQFTADAIADVPDTAVQQALQEVIHFENDSNVQFS